MAKPDPAPAGKNQITEQWYSTRWRNYEVSDLGRVRSVDREVTDSLGRTRFRPGVVLTPSPNKGGYLCVVLWEDGVGKSVYVHTLVAEAFLPPKPDGLNIEPNHKNGRKDDCRASNLEWKTHRDNCIHAIRTGLRKRFVIGGRTLENPHAA